MHIQDGCGEVKSGSVLRALIFYQHRGPQKVMYKAVDCRLGLILQSFQCKVMFIFEDSTVRMKCRTAIIQFVSKYKVGVCIPSSFIMLTFISIHINFVQVDRNVLKLYSIKRYSQCNTFFLYFFYHINQHLLDLSGSPWPVAEPAGKIVYLVSFALVNLKFINK